MTKEELLKKVDALHESVNDIDKVILILEDWENEYFFNERPNVELIFDINTGVEDVEKQQALKWYWEYHVIVGYIQIVKDYVYKVENSLKDVLEKEDR